MQPGISVGYCVFATIKMWLIGLPRVRELSCKTNNQRNATSKPKGEVEAVKHVHLLVIHYFKRSKAVVLLWFCVAPFGVRVPVTFHLIRDRISLSSHEPKAHGELKVYQSSHRLCVCVCVGVCVCLSVHTFKHQYL